MSGKRFVLDKLEKGNAILSVKITDSVKDDNYFIMTKEAYEDDIDEIVDKLNELYEENEKLRRLFEEMKRPITINLTEEDEKELRKLLGLIDDE